MLRRFVVTLLLAAFAGCAKPDLPAVVVQSSSPGALRIFRSELG